MEEIGVFHGHLVYFSPFGMLYQEKWQLRGPFLTSPLPPRGKLCPLGVMLTLLFTPGMNTLYCLEEWRGEQRISPPGDKIHPLGTTSPLGSKFAPRGEVKNGPQISTYVSGSFEFVTFPKIFFLIGWT
jgi:hypothetical protein